MGTTSLTEPQSGVHEPLPVGTVLQGRYRITSRLGHGGMGAVYEASDARLDTRVALKQSFCIEERLRTQFQSEARLLASLSHPALPRVTDYFIEGGRNFLVMQFVEGVDLAQILLTQPGPLPRDRVVAWADQLLDALIYLHARDRQVIHRDIKPHNLKLKPDGNIALLDFGLAKERTSLSLSESESVFGFTRRYAPLEQILDEGTTERSDIYALGATLYHLLTGVKPPDAEIRAAALSQSIADPLLRADAILPVVGEDLALILERALALRAADRYESALDFRKALAGLGRIDGGEVSERVGSGDETIVFDRSRAVSRPLIVVVGLIAVVGVWAMFHFWKTPAVAPMETVERAQVSQAAAVKDVGDRSNGRTGDVARRKQSSRIETQETRPSSKIVVRARARRAEASDRKQVVANHQSKVIVVRPQSKSARSVTPKRPLESQSETLLAPDGTEVIKYADGRVHVHGGGERRSQSRQR